MDYNRGGGSPLPGSATGNDDGHRTGATARDCPYVADYNRGGGSPLPGSATAMMMVIESGQSQGIAPTPFEQIAP